MINLHRLGCANVKGFWRIDIAVLIEFRKCLLAGLCCWARIRHRQELFDGVSKGATVAYLLWTLIWPRYRTDILPGIR